MRTGFFFLLAELEHDLGAADVGLDGADRRLDDQLHADGGRQVEDDVATVDQLGTMRRAGVLDRVDGDLEALSDPQVVDVLDAARWRGHRGREHLVAPLETGAPRGEEPMNPAPPVTRKIDMTNLRT